MLALFLINKVQSIHVYVSLYVKCTVTVGAEDPELVTPYIPYFNRGRITANLNRTCILLAERRLRDGAYGDMRARHAHDQTYTEAQRFWRRASNAPR